MHLCDLRVIEWSEKRCWTYSMTGIIGTVRTKCISCITLLLPQIAPKSTRSSASPPFVFSVWDLPHIRWMNPSQSRLNRPRWCLKRDKCRFRFDWHLSRVFTNWCSFGVSASQANQHIVDRFVRLLFSVAFVWSGLLQHSREINANQFRSSGQFSLLTSTTPICILFHPPHPHHHFQWQTNEFGRGPKIKPKLNSRNVALRHLYVAHF